MSTQPEALRLADELKAMPERNSISFKAAAELRRLQYEVDAIPAIKEERDALQAEVKATERQVEILSDALAESRKINAELLEALNLITEVGDRAATEIARAAIAKHGGAV